MQESTTHVLSCYLAFWPPWGQALHRCDCNSHILQIARNLVIPAPLRTLPLRWGPGAVCVAGLMSVTESLPAPQVFCWASTWQGRSQLELCRFKAQLNCQNQRDAGLGRRMSACLHVLHRFGCIRLFATLWTVTHQAPLSTGFSRQEYWRGLPCPPQGPSQPRDWTCVSWASGIGGQVLYHEPHLGVPGHKIPVAKSEGVFGSFTKTLDFAFPQLWLSWSLFEALMFCVP